MTTYLPLRVDPPGFTPLPYGLMSVATLVPDSNKKWKLGTEFQPIPCDPAASTTDNCPVGPDYTKLITSDGVPARGAESFTLYADITCSPVGHWDEAIQRAADVFTRGEGRALEEIFWTGAVDTPAGGIIHPHLASDSELVSGGIPIQSEATVLVSGTAVDIVEGVGLLTAELAACYGGVGVLHMPYAALAHMSANHLIERSGQKLQTTGGVPVAFGAGYTGSGPDGTPAPAGHAWLYATGSVMIRRGEIFMPDRISSFDRSVNTVRIFAERTYNVAWDCCHLAILVRLGGIIDGTVNAAT